MSKKSKIFEKMKMSLYHQPPNIHEKYGSLLPGGFFCLSRNNDVYLEYDIHVQTL